MNRLKRFGKETETDRSCRVKMYKAGKNWLTSCQICRYFLNRAVLKRVAVSAGAVAMGMSLSGYVVKADTTSSTNSLITVTSAASQTSEPSATSPTVDNVAASAAVASNSSAGSQAASSSANDSKSASAVQSNASAVASTSNDQNDSAFSVATNSQNIVSSAAKASSSGSGSATTLAAASSAAGVQSAAANQIARVAMVKVNAAAESTELVAQTTDYQALTKDWNVDAKGNVTYTGKSTDLTTITIPNNYDFYQAGKANANQKLTIAASVIHNLMKQNRDLTELIISSDGDGKLYATGNWTAAFSGYDDNYLNQYNSKIKSLDLGGLDVSGVTSMARMFYGDNQLVRITGLSNWNTAKVTDMSYMFSGTSKLSTLDSIENWNVAKVSNMDYMFNQAFDSSCEWPLTLNLSNWKTTSLTKISHIFYYAGITNLNISNWNLSKLAKQTRSQYIFSNAGTLQKSKGDNEEMPSFGFVLTLNDVVLPSISTYKLQKYDFNCTRSGDIPLLVFTNLTDTSKPEIANLLILLNSDLSSFNYNTGNDEPSRRHSLKVKLSDGTTKDISISRVYKDEQEQIAAIEAAIDKAEAKAGYTIELSPTISSLTPAQRIANTYQITYVAQPQTTHIVFEDESGNVIQTKTITGKTDETVSVDAVVPTGWEIVSGTIPAQITLVGTGTPDTIIKIKHIIISTATTKTTVKRIITITYPDQTVKTIEQDVKYQRTATTDKATGKTTYSEWQVDGDTDNFAAIDLTNYQGNDYTKAGYTMMIDGQAGTTITQATPNAEAEDSTVAVTFTPIQHTMYINYVDGQGRIIKSQEVSGYTDETKVVDLSAPTEWLIMDGTTQRTIVFKADGASDVTVKVEYARIYVEPTDPKSTTDPLPDNPSKFYPAGVEYNDLNKLITRTITIVDPKTKNSRIVTQTVHFTRRAIVDEVVGTLIGYTNWQTSDAVWDAVDTASLYPGYTPSDTVKQKTVSVNDTDQAVIITFTANPAQQTVRFMNGSTQVGQDYVLTGKTDDIVNMPELPDGWQLATGETLPQNVQLAAVDTPIVIQIVAGLCTISTATAAGTLIPGTKNQKLQVAITDADLSKTVTQTVIIINPINHTKTTQTQIVKFTRAAVINMTNGKLDHYTDWQSEGTDYFNEVTLPTFAGYTPKAVNANQESVALTTAGDLPAVTGVKADQGDTVIMVSYQADPVDVIVIFKDENGNQIGTSTTIHGQTDESLTLTNDSANHQVKIATGLTHTNNPNTIALPTNWELTDSNDLSTVKMASGQTIALLIRHQTTDVSATDANATETFTRTINIFDPYQGQLAPIIQTATFHRSAIKDLVTGTVTYGSWVPAQGNFVQVEIPTVAGYTPDKQVNDETVDPLKGKDEVINIHYQANDGNIQEIDYVDQDGNIVDHVNLSGKTDSVAKISYEAPTNWQIKAGQTLPDQVTFKVYNPVIKVVIEHQTRDVTDRDQELNIQTHKTVTRQITITTPTGQSSTIKQSAQFKRQATQDLVTGAISYGNWQWQSGDKVFSQIVPTAIAGYTPNYQIIEAITPTADTSDSIYLVSYQANPGQQTISYRDANGFIVLTQIITGVTDQIVNVPSVLPTGWELITGQAMPATVTIKPTDTPIVILVQHQLKDVTDQYPDQTQDTVNRIINIHFPDGQVKSITQTVNFKRTATLDLVTKQVTYGKWQNDGSFEAIPIDPIAGYKASQDIVPKITPTAMADDITINVTYLAQKETQSINYVDENNQGGSPIATQSVTGLTGQNVKIEANIPANWELVPGTTIPASVKISPNAAPIVILIRHQHQDVSATDSGAVKIITRTINFTYPDGSKQTVTQTAKFTRTAIKDLVDNTVEYGTWQGSDIFEVVDVPQFVDYYSNLDIVHSMEPTPETKDQVINVTYSAKPITTRIVQYVDENGQLIGADTISGQVDSFVAYQLKLPEHWTFVDAGNQDGATISIDMNAKGAIIYRIKHQTTTSQITKDFKRTVILHKPSGDEKIEQSAQMTADQTHDEVTGQDVYSNWQVVKSFDAIEAAKIAYAGYQASVNEIAAADPDENMATETTIDVTYTANPGVQTIEYVDGAGNVIAKLLITGLVDQNVKLDTNQGGNAALPANWKLTDGVVVPASLKIQVTDTIIKYQVEHQTEDVSATDPDAQKTVTRIINIFDPHQGKYTLPTETITLKRTAIKDLVTNRITYGAWQNPYNQEFAEYTVPQIMGYTASRERVAAYKPVGEDTVLTYNITYTANEQSVVVIYQDDQQNVIGQAAVSGKTDQSLTIDFTSALPDGWVLADGQADHQQITFTGSKMMPITVKIVHGQVTVDPADPKTPQDRLPHTKNDFYPNGVDYNKLNRTIARNITVIYPDGHTKLIKQTVQFKRNATVDTVTKAVLYGEWQVVGNSSFDQFVPDELTDYLPSLKVIEAATPTPEDVDGNITITYYNRYTTQTIEYVDADTGERIGNAQVINGETGTTVDLTLDLPDGWGLDENQAVPGKVAMKVVDTPIKLKIRHMAYQVDFDHPVQKGDLIAGTKDRHYQVDLTEDVLNRYAVRTIVITDLQGNQTKIIQRVHFVRSVWVDAVTGLPIIPLESIDWQTLNTKSIWNAVSIPQIDGYQAIITDADTGQQLSSIDKETPSATSNQTINVIYQAKTGQRIINYVDENGNVIGTQTVTGDLSTTVPVKLNLPKNWQLANQDDQLVNVEIKATSQPIEILITHQLAEKDPQIRQITRTINFRNPLNQNALTTVVQTATFKRAVYHDLVSGTDTYGEWIPLVAKWDELVLPDVKGYEPSQTVAELSVTPDTANVVLNVEYPPKAQLQTVNYVDQNGNLIKTQNFTGKVGETITPDFKLPAGWRLITGEKLPTTLTIKAQNVPLVLTIEHSLVKQADEMRTISRTIKLYLPDGKIQSKVQTVKFIRTVARDLVTNQFVYGTWQRQGQFEALDVPTFAGYQPSIVQVPMIVPTADSADSTVEVDYEPQIETQLIQFVYQNGTTSQVITEQFVSGKTGQWVALNLAVPKTWQLTSDQIVPTMIQIKAQSDPIIIYIQHKQKDVTDITADTERTVTRTIKIVYPNGQVETIVQEATFYRTATEDEVTGKIVYGKWQGSDVFEAVDIPKIDGWQPSLDQVELSKPNANTPDSTAVITYSQNQSVYVIQYVDSQGNYVESQPFWGKPGETIKITPQLPSGWQLVDSTKVPDQIVLTEGETLHKVYVSHIIQAIDENDPDLHVTVTRTINITLPDGQIKQIVQKVSFIRIGFEDQVTKQRSYGRWTAEDDGSGDTDRFAEIKLPTINGWVPSQTVVAEFVPNATSHSTTINVTYLPGARSRVIDYVDEDNQLIRSDAIVGRTGETVAAQSSVPTGWEIVSGTVPDTITFDEANDDQPIKIVIRHRVVSIDAKQAAQLSQVDASQLLETIVREIKVYEPHQDQPMTVKQQVVFQRLGQYDLVTKKFVGFGDWEAVGSTLMEAYRVPKIAGYRPSVSGIGEQDTQAGDTDETIVITYVANPQTIHINYMDAQGNVISSDLINGHTEETVPVKINVPAGWKLAVDQSVPTNITFGATTPEVTIRIVHAVVTVQPDQAKTTADVLPDNPDQHYPSGVDYDDLNRTITRTIIFKLPDGQIKTIKQTVRFVRSAEVDEVDGRVVYSDWQAIDGDEMPSVAVPAVDGYLATTSSIPELQVTPNSPNTTIVIDYAKIVVPVTPNDQPDQPNNGKNNDKPGQAEASDNQNTEANHGESVINENAASSNSAASHSKSYSSRLPQTGNDDQAHHHAWAGLGLLSMLFSGLLGGRRKRKQS